MKALLLTTCAIGWLIGSAVAEEPAAAKVEGHLLAISGRVGMPPPGSKTTREEVLEFKDAKVRLATPEQVMNGTLQRREVRRKSFTAISPTHFRYLQEKPEQSAEMSIGGKTQKMPGKADPLEDVAVILEQTKNGFTAELEVGRPTPAQKEAMAKLVADLNADSGTNIYGIEPRKTGDKWRVDPTKLHTYAGMEKHQGFMEVEFVEITEFQGVRCAVLKTSFDLSGKAKGEPGKDLVLRGTSVIHRSLADLINLEGTMKATMIIEGMTGPGTAMRVEGPFTATQKATLSKP